MACAPYPVALNIGNVTLPNGRTARGIDVGIGTPQQRFAFIPNTGFNTTHVYDENTYCDLATSLACTTYRGGQYDPRNSISNVSGLSSSSAGGPSLEETDLETATWVQDKLTLSSNFTLPAFPLAIPRQSIGDVFSPQVGLGLDFNSTLLTTAKNTGRIASRTWSYFWGETGTADDASNGTLVLGGYDAAKTVGQNYTQRLTYGLACEDGLLLAITDMTMIFPNDTAYCCNVLRVGNWIDFIPVATVSPLFKSLSDRSFHFRRGASSTPYHWRLRFTDKMIMDRGDLVLARHEAEVERLELKFILSMNTNVDDHTSIAMTEQAIGLAGDISRVTGRVRKGLEKYPDGSARKEELATLTVELRSAGEKIDKAMEEADKQMN
ncbi:hypothetical protein LTR95_013405 [Oleoguttula sp. CCFEE 5521]